MFDKKCIAVYKNYDSVVALKRIVNDCMGIVQAIWIFLKTANRYSMKEEFYFFIHYTLYNASKNFRNPQFTNLDMHR